MTDLVAKPQSADGTESSVTTASSGDSVPPTDHTVAYAWAPEGPAPKRRRLWLWIGVPVAAVVVGAGAAALLLVAPGTSVAGVPIGGLTAAAAASAVQDRLATTSITFRAPDGDVVLTGAELGATVNATALADAAFAERPAWNLGSWFGDPIAAPVTLDAARADAALEQRLPDFYSTATDATLTYDGGAGTYTVAPGTSGAGIDLATVTTELSSGFAAGASDVSVTATSIEVPASTTTAIAQQTADTLNTMIGTAGFYVGDERTVPVNAATLSSWLTVAKTPDGGFSISADAARIQEAVNGLPGAIDRAPVDANVITDTAGKVLSEEVVGLTGRALGSTDGVAAEFSTQLAAGNAVFPLPVTETPFATTAVSRNIVVDLGAQMTYLYENGQVIRSWSVSSGKAGTPTHAGNFRVYAHVRQQNMGCVASVDYCTPDVPYVTYFNGDEAFHGTYWHNNFGNPMSHGCINMRIPEAQFVYNWAPVGTEVSVRS